jgi:hypothetical protein
MRMRREKDNSNEVNSMELPSEGHDLQNQF